MACDLTLGRLEPCKDSVGGIKAIYFGNFLDDDIITVVTNEVTDWTVAAATTKTVYKYEVKGGAGLEQTINSSRETGTTFFDQVLTVLLKGMDTATTNEVKLLAYGRPRIVVHLWNGDALLVGKESGADVTGGSIVTGTAKGDLNGYNLTFSAQEVLPAIALKSSTLANPFAGLTTPPTVVVGT